MKMFPGVLAAALFLGLPGLPASAAGSPAASDSHDLAPPSGKAMSDSSIECKIDNTEPTLARAIAKPTCDPATRDNRRTSAPGKAKDGGSPNGDRRMHHQNAPASPGGTSDGNGSGSY